MGEWGSGGVGDGEKARGRGGWGRERRAGGGWVRGGTDRGRDAGGRADESGGGRPVFGAVGVWEGEQGGLMMLMKTPFNANPEAEQPRDPRVSQTRHQPFVNTTEPWMLCRAPPGF